MWTVYKKNQERFEKAWKLNGSECDSRCIMRMTDWLCRNPAIMMGIQADKGSIAKGKYADFVVWDPDESRLCTDDTIFTYNPTSCLYLNGAIDCEIKYTFLRGTLIFDYGKLKAKQGRIIMPNNQSHLPILPGH